MSYVNSTGSRQDVKVRIEISIVTFDFKRPGFSSYSATVEVHPRWRQRILDCFCCAESQHAGLSAKPSAKGHRTFTMNADLMRETRQSILDGSSPALCEASALDGRVKMILREAIGHCEQMIVGACGVASIPGQEAA